ncbi:MAG: hypothetical protein ACJAZ2_000640 [Glaciecola sp.]|jgi:hypothetical protein
MKRRLKVLMAIFVLSIFVFLYLNSKDRGNVSEDEREITIDDIGDVSKVTMLSSKGKQIDLEIKKGEWFANGNQVRGKKIIKLKKIITELKVKKRVPSSSVDSILTMFDQHHVLVKYLNNDKELIAYKVIAQRIKKNEVLVLKSGSKTPYYAHVFGEEIDFSSLFTTDVSAWNSLVIADFADMKITKVCTGYPLVKDYPFCLTVKDSLIKFDKSTESLGIMDLKKAVNYLRAFKLIKASRAYSNPKVIRDLIGDKDPFFELVITTTTSNIKLRGFKKKSGLNQVDFNGDTLRFDNDHFYITANNKLYLMDYFSFEDLIKSGKYFVNE